MIGATQLLLRKLTTNLFATYSDIHASAKHVDESIERDGDQDCPLRPGLVLNQRYIVQGRIGKGSFGQVVQAIDSLTNAPVAIKIIKRLRLFSEQARNEIRLLNLLKDRDPGRLHHIVTILDWFVHDTHQCMVFEMLSASLYDVLRANQYRGVPLAVIRHIGRQLLEALLFLKANSVMNCDMKPENVLLCAPDRYDIKLIDFGSSCLTNEQMYTYIQSRFYRSPEVLLGLPLDTGIDMWSLGCILVELFTGHVLFNGADEVDQVGKLISVLGVPPSALLTRATKTNKYFAVGADGRFRFRHLAPGAAQQASGRSLADVLAVYNTHRFTKTRSDRLRLLDLIERMLDYEAGSRITPSQALIHPFIADSSNPLASKSIFS